MTSSSLMCNACFETFRNNSQPIPIGPFFLCLTCVQTGIIPKFHAAYLHELDHPASFGAELILSIQDFASFFTKDFLSAYHKKLEQYAIPIPHRLYCTNIHNTTTRDICGHFIGSKATATSQFLPCTSCSIPGNLIHICTTCRESFPGPCEKHSCSGDILQDPLKDLQRGVDYQLCPNPNCKIIVQRTAGCIHMICKGCGTDFCYICGELQKDGLHNHDLVLPVAAAFPHLMVPGPAIIRQEVFFRHVPLWQHVELILAVHRVVLAASVTEDVSARQLIALLIDELVVYDTLWDNPAMDLEVFLEEHQGSHERIVELADGMDGEVWIALPRLRVIYDTYVAAWYGRDWEVRNARP